MPYTAGDLPFWTLPVPTVDGSRILTCHYVEPQHTAARVAAGALVTCSGCSRVLTDFCWTTRTRSVALCGACHQLDHRHRADQLRANAADLTDPTGQLPGQTSIEV